MPQIEDGKSVEQLYWEHVRQMSPAEKVRKAVKMNVSVRRITEEQIRQKYPGISGNALNLAVARRRYWDEPKTLAMLDEIEAVILGKSDG